MVPSCWRSSAFSVATARSRAATSSLIEAGYRIRSGTSRSNAHQRAPSASPVRTAVKTVNHQEPCRDARLLGDASQEIRHLSEGQGSEGQGRGDALNSGFAGYVDLPRESGELFS